MRRVPRELWWIAGLTLLAGLLAWALAGGRKGGGSDELAPDTSTFNSAPSGLRALYLTLDGLHYPVRRTSLPYPRGLPERGPLVVVQPRVPLTEGEVAALTRWIRDGHTLICAGDAGMRSLVHVSPDPTPLSTVETTRAWPAQPTYLARGVAELSVKITGGLQTAGADAGSTRRVSEPSMLAETDLPRDLEAGAPVFRQGEETVVTYQRYGRGRIIALASPWSLSNQGLARADNLTFALNALGPPDPARPIFFDEYHHGHGEGSLASVLASRTQVLLARLVIVQLGLALLLVMYARSRRLGRVVPLSREVRQRSEFLGTMTAVLRRGQATRLVVQTARDALAGRLERQLGLPAKSASAELAAAAGRVNAEAAKKLGEALQRCDAAVAAGRSLPQPAALALLRDLDEAERELRKL